MTSRSRFVTLLLGLVKYQVEKEEYMAKATISLWYETDARAAAEVYAVTFPGSSLDAVRTAPTDFPGGRKGDELTVEFTVLGLP